MAERNDLLASIATTTVDYREGDLDAPTPQHVDRWVGQFDEEVQLPILREMDHVLKHTYFSKTTTRDFLVTLFNTEKLVGNDPCPFWNGGTRSAPVGMSSTSSKPAILSGRLLKKLER